MTDTGTMYYTTERGEIAAGSRGRSGTREASELLVSLALQSVRGETRGHHRIARAEPAERSEEQAAEQQGHADLGHAEHRRRPAVDRRHDLEIALQPDPEQAHERERRQQDGRLFGLDAEQADERHDEHQEEHRDAERPPGIDQPIEDEERLLGHVAVPD